MTQPRKARSRAPHQLPPGRHKLSRPYVEANQRERIFEAIAEVTSLAGYAAMSVEEIISLAGVSRRTFYDNFTSKEDAFLAALDASAERLIARIEEAYRSSQTFAAGVRECLATFLNFAADDPRGADMLIVEVLAAGPAAISRRNVVMHAFAQMLRAAAANVPDGRRPPDITAETIIGGIYEVVYARLLQGLAGELPDLLEDLAYSMMQPYLGHDAAKWEASEPSTPARRFAPAREERSG